MLKSATITQRADEVSEAGQGLKVLTTWAAAVRPADLPDAVVQRLKHSLRDALGCAVFGATLEWSRIGADAFASQSSGGPATVWGTGQRLEATSAAVVNGMAVQSFEMDDSHAAASLHGSSTMVPALLALGEVHPGVSGAELLASLAVGWEVAVRVNDCLGFVLVDGWHQPTMMGAIAAAAASGRLLRLAPDQMYHCVSLGILQAAGLTVVQYGGMAKRLYAGRAAEVGVQAALLARGGFTAPPDALGHEFGSLLSSFAPGKPCAVEVLTSGLGERYAADGISFKLHSCCYLNQAPVDMMADLVEQNPAITAETIESIEIATTEHGYKHAGYPYVPDTAVTAQFSIEYCLAAFLLEGAVFVDQFRDELLADPRLLGLVSRMTTTADDNLHTADPRSKRAVRLTVSLRDGRVFNRQGMVARGHSDNPASETQLRAKFDRLTVGTLGGERAAALSEAVMTVDGLADVRELVSLTISA